MVPGKFMVFGVGIIASMLLVTAAIALPFAYAVRRFERLHRALGLASGLLSVAFGFLPRHTRSASYFGLFTSHPQWTPN